MTILVFIYGKMVERISDAKDYSYDDAGNGMIQLEIKDYSDKTQIFFGSGLTINVVDNKSTVDNNEGK